MALPQFQHAAFRQDLPATPANLPLNYWHPPPGQSSYTYDTYVPRPKTAEEIRIDKEIDKEREERKQKEKERERKVELYDSVIYRYIVIEYIKQHYQDNKKSQNLFVKIQSTITILQILGVAVIYFNYSYSVLIFLGVFCLDTYAFVLDSQWIPSGYYHNTSWSNEFTGFSLFKCIKLEKFKEENYKLYRYYKTEAINHYGTIRDHLEDRIESDFNKYLNDMVHDYTKKCARREGYKRVVPESVVQLRKSYNTAKQFSDCSFEKCNVYYNFCKWFCIIFSIFGIYCMLGLWDEIGKKNYFPNERKNHTDTEIAFKYTMFIIGSLFIVFKLIVRHIIIKCCYNPKIDISPLFVIKPSERQPLLTNTIV